MNKKGFSLIEILIVISIIGIITAVGLVSLSPAKTSSKLDASRREVASALKLAQSYALQGKAVSIGGKNVVPCGYGVNFKDSINYEIFYLYEAGTACEEINKETVNFSSPVTLETYQLKNGVQFRASDSINKKVYFTVPHGLIFGDDGKYITDIWINIYLEISGKYNHVSITKGGSIVEMQQD